MKKCVKTMIVLTMIICMFFARETIVKAIGAVGSYSYATVYGCKYKYYSSVYRNEKEVWAYATVTSDEGRNYPIGYFGANARLYDSFNNLIVASGWEYNTSELGGMARKTTNIPSTSGIFYSKGQVRMYNGNGYNTYTTTQSPNLSPVSRTQANDCYKINENGEIYGSEYILNQYGIEPDLIQAIGNEGVSGYVKAVELNEIIPASPEEAIRYQSELPDKRIINLYDCSGNNIIGTFTVYYGEVEEITY